VVVGVVLKEKVVVRAPNCALQACFPSRLRSQAHCNPAYVLVSSPSPRSPSAGDSHPPTVPIQVTPILVEFNTQHPYTSRTY
jgi:hypothetical protein